MKTLRILHQWQPWFLSLKSTILPASWLDGPSTRECGRHEEGSAALALGWSALNRDNAHKCSSLAFPCYHHIGVGGISFVSVSVQGRGHHSPCAMSHLLPSLKGLHNGMQRNWSWSPLCTLDAWLRPLVWFGPVSATHCTSTNSITSILERLFNLRAEVCKRSCPDFRLSLLRKSSCSYCFLETSVLRPLLDKKFLHHASLCSIDKC